MSYDDYPPLDTCPQCGTTVQGHREDVIPYHCRCGLTFAERIPLLHIILIMAFMLSSGHFISHMLLGTALYEINYVALLVALIPSFFYVGGLSRRLSQKNGSQFYVYGNIGFSDLIYSVIYMLWDMLKMAVIFILLALASFLLIAFLGPLIERTWPF